MKSFCQGVISENVVLGSVSWSVGSVGVTSADVAVPYV